MPYPMHPHEEFEGSLDSLKKLVSHLDAALKAADSLEDNETKKIIKNELNKCIADSARLFHDIQEARNKLSHYF